MAEEEKKVAAPKAKKTVAKKPAAEKKTTAAKKTTAKKAPAKKAVEKTAEKAEVKEAEKTPVKKTVKEVKPEVVKEEKKELEAFKTRKPNIKDYDFILGPVVTEKTQALQVSNNTMTLRIRNDATASQVKSAVQAIFGVKVDKVNMVNVRPRDKRSTKYAGTIPGFKKAYVKINKDYNLGEIAKASQSEVK